MQLPQKAGNQVDLTAQPQTDVCGLTEDYDIGFRLKQMGMQEVFVRFPIHDERHATSKDPRSGRSDREASVIAVREYFPNTLRGAVRQKSRWILGIVIQGFRTLKWTKSGALNYFLWRDRKGIITNFASFLATLLTLQLIAIWIYQRLVPDSYRFLSVFEGDWWLYALLAINLVLMFNRIVQRAYFVTSYYGFLQGLMSVPRLIWGNFVNFLANWRAVAQALKAKDIRRMAWSKTDHDFPQLGESSRQHRPIGQILLDQGALTAAQLQHAVEHPIRGLRLGSALVHQNIITTEQLAAAVAEQASLQWESMGDCLVAEHLAAMVPAAIALRYSVVPLREEGDVLVLATESNIDPVSLAALERKLGRPVRHVIVPKGEVTVELRRLYARHETEPAHELLQTAVRQNRVTHDAAPSIWTHYVSRQLQLGEVMLAVGRIEPAVLGALLLRHEKSEVSLGSFLIQQGVLTQPVLDECVQLQKKLQISMAQLLGYEPAVPHLSATA